MALPLDLFVEVNAPDGQRYKWGANQPPGSRLRNMSFTTKIGEGFSGLQGQLSRRSDLDYPDLQLINDVVVTGSDGSVAFEGRVSAMPREIGEGHSIGVTATGWIAHMKDKKFQEIYVDRDLNAWGPMSVGRRAVALGANFSPSDPQQAADPTDNQAGVRTGWTGPWSTGFSPMSEAWYDAGPNLLIGAVNYAWKRLSPAVNNADVNWNWKVFSGSDDKTTVADSGQLRAAGPSGLQAFVFPAAQRYAALQLSYPASPAGADGVEYSLAWYKLAVFGNHSAPVYTGITGEPGGVRAGDVIRDITRRWCPMLDPAGIVDTSYVIQQLAFKDLTYPFDALLEINKYHLWQIAVWENKTLHFKPYDLSDYDWEVRTDDPGTTFSPQGPSVDDVFNGMTVTYTDLLSGKKNVLTADAYTDLTTPSSVENPWDAWGIDHHDYIELSTPTLQPQALLIGKAALADRNTPKTPGTITVKGYVRDRQGNQQPAWKVRAGDTIAVSNWPNDTPRLVVETNYSDEDKSLSMSIDRPFALIDAYLDRVANAVSARSLA